MTLPELSAANLVEIKDDAGWSLSVNFGRGDKARDAMRAFSDAIRTGQLVERDAVAGVLDEAWHVIASHYPRTGPTGIRSIDSRSTAFREFEPPAVLAKIEAARASLERTKP